MILAPFKWIVALFFNWSLALFGDPGWAVVGMSVLLSLLLTPIYVWIERCKKENKTKSAPMQAEIDKITAVYTGRERYYYTREIQRRFHYNPWLAMIPTLGLLVQIPFLLAAYHYLTALSIFDGVSFWYIRDLSKPDTIAHFFDQPINLLPILMTAVNLVSGWRYAESGSTKERVQYMIVALLFLFLLYNCASAVLIYWTLSNVLAMVRSEIFFIGHGKTKQRSHTPLVLTDAVFVIAYRVFPVLLIMVACCLLLRYQFGRSGSPARLAVYWKVRSVVPYLIGIVLLTGGVLLCYSRRVVRLLRDMALGWRKPLYMGGNRQLTLFALAVSYVLLTILVWHPLMIYSLDPAAFFISVSRILGYGLLCSVSAVVALCLLWRFVLARTLPALALRIALCLALVVLFYLFVCPVKMGTLQGGELMNATSLVRTLPEYLFECVLLYLLWLGVGWLSKRMRFSALLSALIVLHCIVVGQTASRLSSLDHADAKNVTRLTASTFVPEKQGIRLSRRHKNIVVFLLDMVQGASFRNVMDDPTLASGLNGFVWYSNCAAIANMTDPSLPGLYGGAKYFLDNIGRLPGSVNEKCTQAMYKLKEEVENIGCEFSHYSVMAPLVLNDLNRRSPLYDRVFLSEITKRKDVHATSSMLGVLRCNAWLQAMPFVIKNWIYNNGWWRWCQSEDDPFCSFGKDHAFYMALPKLSFAHDGERGNFNFFHAEVTHNPWGIPTEDGRFVKTDNVGELKWVMKQLCAYMEWMKKEGVYDNTRIILISDHGLVNMDADSFDPKTDPMLHRERWADLMSGMGLDAFEPEYKCQMLNCLLAVKDFVGAGRIAEECRLMSNGTLHDLIFCENVGAFVAKQPYSFVSFVVMPPKDGTWFNGKPDYLPKVGFRIRDNVYDLNNWERIYPAEAK